MKEKHKKTIQIIGMGILIAFLSILAYRYSFPLDPNPWEGI